MANKQKSGRITIANVIAIVGLVLLLVFSYIGHSYMSGGEVGWDVIISIAITAFAAFLLWFLIKAKGAENRLEKWRKIEYLTLIIYILFAIPASLFGGIMHFFVVNDQKEDFKKYAYADLSKIDNLFDEYTDFEQTAISKTGNGLYRATMVNHEVDTKLGKFMKDNNIVNSLSAKNFENIQTFHLLGDGFKNFHESFRKQKSEIESVINSWSIMQIPLKTKLIGDLADNVETELTKLSYSAKLPTIISDGRYYRLDEDSQYRDFKIDHDSFEFSNKIKNATGFSISAVLVVILIHILILFNYIVAYRTSTLDISKHGDEDGGRILK